MAQIKPPALDVLTDVLAFGERAGFWTVVDRHGNEDRFAHVDVRDPEANGATLRFQISTYDGKVRACVAERNDGKPYGQGLRVLTSDVKENYTDSPPEASASADRGAEAIAKTLHRRIIADPVAQGYARRVRERIAERVQSREKLLAIVQGLRDRGFTMLGNDRTVSDTEYWSVTMYGPGSIQMRVSADGTLYVDRLSTHVDHIEDLMKIARR